MTRFGRNWMCLVVWLEERHAANVHRANPWPTTSGAVTTKGAKMSERVKEARCHYCGHALTLTKVGMFPLHHPYGSICCEGSGKDPRTASKAPSSDSQPPAADSGTELRPCDSVACMVAAAKRDTVIWKLNATILERDATLVDLQLAAQKALKDAAHEIAGLRQERDEALATIARMWVRMP